MSLNSTLTVTSLINSSKVRNVKIKKMDAVLIDLVRIKCDRRRYPAEVP
jgi:hypothetical protein